jgi:hypothetical protein
MRQLPQVYAQRDPRWAGVELGTCPGATIGQFGCYLSSFAMLACYYGHQITPPGLDALFREGAEFVDQDLCSDNDLQAAFGDCVYVETRDYSTQPADLQYLRDALADPSRSVILELDFDHNPSDGIQTHFVVAVDCDGTDVSIADPWYGGVAPFAAHYGPAPATTIQKLVVYSGTPAQSSGGSQAPSGGDQARDEPQTQDQPQDGGQSRADGALQQLALDPQTAAVSDEALKQYFEQLGVGVNLDTAILKRAVLAFRRGETRGPAVTDEYPTTALDGRAVVRQGFSAAVAEYDPATGTVSWAELVLHPEEAPPHPSAGSG